ncbi:ABC1 family-like protein [Fragilaria crotonensis]|nr:ABC1 family-like protein [Fragilaria crotonensis]
MKNQRKSLALLISFLLLMTRQSSFALVATPRQRPLGRSWASQLSMAVPTSSSSTTPSRRKKSVQERTPEEAVSLIKDVLTAVMEAGPRAGPARTLQAYRALTSTIQDFVPAFQRQPEQFSAPVALRKLFERLGATYVKLGQFVASSPTIFPAEYVTEFQKCLDQTEPLDWSVIKGVIESELGPISRSFSYVDPKPLASASIAQVHRGTLRTGEQVVIKVQKPRIDESLKADLSFIFVASRILEFLQPDWERTSLSAIAGDIRSSMLQELDFKLEANNVEEFREFLLEQQLNTVATAPRVYREFTGTKVLTMEYLDGVSLLNKEAIATITSNDPESIIVNALNVWTASVQNMPFFHADVHAGNLLVLRDGRVGFIDFGIVGRVSPKTFQAVNELSVALALRDYRGMAQALCNMGATDEEVDIVKFGSDIEMLLNDLSMVQPDVTIAAMADGSVAGSVSVSEQEVTNIVLAIVKVTEDNGLKLPREFGLLVKQSLYFDRYLKILAPGLDVMTSDRLEGINTAPVVARRR